MEKDIERERGTFDDDQYMENEVPDEADEVKTEK